MRDEIIREVEATREKIAERHAYDVRKIAAYLRDRAASRQAREAERASSELADEIDRTVWERVKRKYTEE